MSSNTYSVLTTVSLVHPFGRALWTRVREIITTEWCIVQVAGEFLDEVPQVVSRKVYTCYSAFLLYQHLKLEEMLDGLIRGGQAELIQREIQLTIERRISEEAYAQELLEDLDRD